MRLRRLPLPPLPTPTPGPGESPAGTPAIGPDAREDREDREDRDAPWPTPPAWIVDILEEERRAPTHAPQPWLEVPRLPDGPPPREPGSESPRPTGGTVLVIDL